MFKNEIRLIKKNIKNKTKKINVTWKTGLKTNFILTGKLNTKFSFEYIGSKSSKIKTQMILIKDLKIINLLFKTCIKIHFINNIIIITTSCLF